MRHRALAGVLLLAAAALPAPAGGHHGRGPSWLMGEAAVRACTA